MKKPHKHAELIKAWADGAEIEAYAGSSSWVTIPSPEWYSDTKYRIKPEPKPDLVYYGVFSVNGLIAIDSCFTKYHDEGDHIKVTFDGETGKLKSAEIL
jgi:hypothetical protein